MRLRKPKSIMSIGRTGLWFGFTLIFLLATATHLSAGPYTFTTMAGSAGNAGTNNGPRSIARFTEPVAVAVDTAGNVCVADAAANVIRKITPGGVVTTLAGQPGVTGSTDGTGSAALFNNPGGVAVDSAGNVYVADSQNNTIRKITPSGAVTTFAGKAGVSGTNDGVGTNALFHAPGGLTVDTASNVYVADTSNFTVRKITAAGSVSTLAGQPDNTGYQNGTGNAAQFASVFNIAVDTSGNLYVSDSDTIRRITSAGTVTTIAGQYDVPGSSDGLGTNAHFDLPRGVRADVAGNLYVADTVNSTIRKMTLVGTNWMVTTIGGLAQSVGSADGLGTMARFNNPYDVAVDGTGNIYVADQGNYTIREGYLGAGFAFNVSGGVNHSLFIKSDSSLWGMGDDNYGELGNGTNIDQFSPEMIVPTNVVAVVAGSENSLFLKSDGSLWGMGENSNGELGNGTLNEQQVPEEITNGVMAIAGGEGHSLFLKSDGSLWAMGLNSSGELGDGTTVNQTTPEMIVSNNVTAIAAGSYHSLFIKSNGSLWAMGNDEEGQLGDSSTGLGTNRPEMIVASNVTAIAAGDTYSLFLKSDGSLWGMGDNSHDQLGKPGITQTNQPTQIVSSNVTAIAAGSYHSLFLKSDGSLWGMGENGYGELGLSNTISFATTPTQILPGHVAVVSAGSIHSLFIMSDGSLWGMGGNDNGDLGLNLNFGNGTLVDQYMPAEIGPSVLFDASPTNGSSPLNVQFTGPTSDSQGNAIASWSWNFDDASGVNTNQSPSHTYTFGSATTFYPSLQMTNANGFAVAGFGPAIGIIVPTIQFTASPTNGNAPLTVAFTSPSQDTAGNTITNWHWNFGDGSGVSTNQNPTYIYDGSGTFHPILTVHNNSGVSLSASGLTISVSPSDLTNFVFTATPNNGPAPLSVQFEGPGNQDPEDGIQSWSWDFGDGGNSTNQSPSYTYEIPGFYTPSVLTTAFNDNTASPPGPTVLVTGGTIPPSVPVLSNSPYLNPGSNGFLSVVTVEGSPNFGFQWSLNGANLAGATNATYNIASATSADLGNYTVVVTNAYGTNSAGPIFMELVGTAQFTANPTFGSPPLLVQFTGPSSDSYGNAITNWSWSFGDEDIPQSTNQNPTATFNDSSTFYPTLTVINSAGAVITATGPSINAIMGVAQNGLVLNGGFETGDFTGWTLSGDTEGLNVLGGDAAHSGAYGASIASVGDLCYLQQTLATTPGATYMLSLWLENPDGSAPNEFLVSWNGQTISDLLNIPPTGWTNLQFLVTATQSSTVLLFGGRDDVADPYLDDVDVESNFIRFTGAPTSGEAALTVQFTATNVDSLGNAITNWSWSFGDGGTSTNQNPTYTYASVGNYTPVLQANNNLGWTVPGFGPSIIVQPPAILVTATPTAGPANLVVNFTSPSTDGDGNLITNWYWDFGDEMGTSTNQNPSYTYSINGTYTASLTAINSSGLSLSAQTPSISVAPYVGLVQNSGFETGNFTGWDLTGDIFSSIVDDDGDVSGISPYSGRYLAALHTDDTFGYLSETLATTPGTSYSLSFFVNSPNTGFPNEFLATWGGNTVFDQTNIYSSGWTSFRKTVTATDTSTVLEFGLLETNGYLGLDDVVVEALTNGAASCFPPPVTLANWYEGEGNALDSIGGDPATLQNGVTFTNGEVGQGFNFNGSSGFLTTATLEPDPEFFSLGLWFKTTTTNGGALIGFSDSQTNTPSDFDRTVYLDDAGVVHFAVNPGSLQAINSLPGYNDGQWHQVIASLSPSDGISLYMDGLLSATNSGVTNAQPYNGWWRMGEGPVSSLPGSPASFYFQGRMDEITIFDSTLSLCDISNIYAAGSAGMCTNALAPGLAALSNVIAFAGQTVTFAPIVSGSAPLSYQWQLNGTNLVDNAQVTGSQSNVLTVTSVTMSNAGIYGVMVTNAYGAAGATATLTVSQADSIISWLPPAPVTYGTPLSAAQLNATANTPGAFVYSPANGFVPPSGSNTLSVTFTPTDTNDYTPTATNVSLFVSRANSIISWSPPAPVTYGTPLSAAQLNATANTPGAFVYSPANGFVPPSGSNTLSVTFTPTDTNDYTTTATNVTLFVSAPAAPTGCTPPPAGLVSWWPAEGDALDFAGGNNGTLFNVGFAPGEVGEGFSFTNVDSGVLLANPTNLQLQNFTIEGWIQRASVSIVTEDPSAFEGNALFFGYGQNGYGFGLFPNGTLDLTKINVDNITSGASVSDTNFHHVAVTKTSSAVIFYVDGVAYPVESPYNDTFQFTTPAAIGARGDTAANNFTGQVNTFLGVIDELSIYSRALSSNEIAAIYSAGSAGKCLGLLGTSVTGSLQLYSEGENLFDPANGGVPPGYANSSSPTVLLGAGNNTFFYGLSNSYNFDSATFNGNILTVTDIMNGSGADPWRMTFTDPAFTGLTPVSDNFINGGINASISGDVITLNWAGSYSPSYVLSGTYTAVFELSNSAPATVINFDNIPDIGHGTQITNGYEGLNWTNFWVFNTPDYANQNSGYITGTVSSPNVAYNFSGDPATISAPAPFILNSGYFTAAWSNGLILEVVGMNGPSMVYSNAATLNTNGPIFVTFPYLPVTRVIFSTDRASQVNSQFVLDNLDVSFNAASVSKTAPILTWAAPASIPYGTSLGSNQLNATATVPGSFVYSPTNGASLNPGAHTLSVVFTPSDTIDYSTVTNSVNLTVTPGVLTVTPANAVRLYGTANPVFTGTITGTNYADGISAVYSCNATAASAAGTYPITATLLDPNNRLGNYAVTINIGTLTISTGVILTSPANGQSYSAPATIPFAATAALPNGVQTFKLYENSVLVASTNTSTISTALNNLSSGGYQLTAVATDSNNQTFSETAYVTVNTAGTTLIDFDALDTSVGAMNNAPLFSYLSAYGVTIANVTFGASLEAATGPEAAGQNGVSGGELPVPSSSPNLFTQVGSTKPLSFELNFAAPLQSFGFTRVALNTNGLSTISHPAWSAHILDAFGNELESVSEPLLLSSTNIPARQFTLVGANIASVRFDSDSHAGTAAFSAVLLDDLLLSTNATNNPLSITLAQPAGGTAPVNITLSATATSTNIDHVSFYSGPTLIGSVSNAPYNYTWSNVLNGTYVLTAQVVDLDGYALFSAPVTNTIQPGGSSLVVNFDAPGALANLATYLAGNGLGVGTNSTGTSVVAENENTVAGGGFVTASSQPNLLTQVGSNGPVSFTVAFSNALAQFSFTRPELLANPYVTHPAWQVEAFDALGLPLGAIMAPQISSSTNVPAQTYTLSNGIGGAGIASVEFSSEGSGLTTFNAMLLDDFVLGKGSNLPPSVVIETPTNGQLFTSLSGIPILAETASGSGTIAGVNYYYNGTLLSALSNLWNAPSNGAYTLTAVASNSLGLSSTSAPVSITIATSGFAITTQPTNQLVGVSNSAVFSVTATGANLSYQWQFNGGALPGQTLSSYTVNNAQSSNSGSYTVIVSSGAQSITSQTATLTVLGPPTISSILPGTNVLVDLGSNVTLSVNATDSENVPFYYQWQRNGQFIAAATNSFYTISNAQPFQSGDYQVLVANAVASQESPVFNVSVNFLGTNAAPTTNALFANSISIDLTNGPVGGNNTGSPTNGGLSTIAGKPAGRFLWYNWTAQFNGIVSISTLGSSFDTLLGVYTGASVASLTPVGQDDDSAGFFDSLVSFNCVQGTTYQIAVAGYKGASGNVVLYSPDYLALDTNYLDATEPAILQQPSSQIVAAGATVTLNVTTTINTTLCQWYLGNAPVAGGVSQTLVISNLQASAAGNYYIQVANGVGSAQSEIASVQIQNAAETVGAPTALAEDKFGDAVDLASASTERYRPEDSGGDTGGFTLSQSFSTVGATKEEDEPNHAGQPGGASYWYSYTAPGNGTLQFNTTGSSFNTILAIYIGPGTSFSTLTNVGAGYTTNYLLRGQPAVLVTNVTAGTKYFIAIDGYLGSSGAAHINIITNLITNAIAGATAVITTNNNARLDITSPVNNYLTTSPTLTVHGTVQGRLAAQSPLLSYVQVAVNTNAYGGAALGATNYAAILTKEPNGSESFVAEETVAWSTNITLVPGANVITAQSISVQNANAETATVPVTHTIFLVSSLPSSKVKSTLTLVARPSGRGRISGQADQASLEINKAYTVRATPIGNWVFTNWTMGTNASTVLGNSETLTFIMASNLTMQANFVTNRFTAVAGIYNGLFSPSNGVTAESSGFFTATLPAASRGAYSARLTLEGDSYPFSGTFDLTGDAQATVNRAGKTPLTVDLHVNLTAPDDQLTGSIINTAGDEWTNATLRAERAQSGRSTNFAGRFTLALPPGSNGPSGYGYATMSASPTGRALVTGRLADKSPFNDSVAIAQDGEIPLYASLYSRQGLLLGWLTVTNSPGKTILGANLTWIKLAGRAGTLFAGGFTNTNIAVLGSFYTPPTHGADNFILTNGTLTISNGGLSDALVYSHLTIDGNKLANVNAAGNPPNLLEGAIAPGTGVLTLKFRPTGATADTVAAGVMLQEGSSTNAAGWFLGDDQSGFFLLQQ